MLWGAASGVCPAIIITWVHDVHKINVHKTSRKRLVYILRDLHTFNLHNLPRGGDKILFKSIAQDDAKLHKPEFYLGTYQTSLMKLFCEISYLCEKAPP